MNGELEKDILDACCGGRLFWYQKEREDVIYMDKYPRDPGTSKHRPNFTCSPDVVGDFTNMTFPDNMFSLVVFDPPHTNTSLKSEIGIKYGSLNGDMRGLIKKGFSECMRVLKPGGFLVFKWAENNFSLQEVLDELEDQPLFGHRTGKTGKTVWLMFRKANGIRDD